MSVEGSPTVPEKRNQKVTNFALGVFADNKDGHIFLGMLPVIDGEIRHDVPPYRFTANAEETLEFFEKFKVALDGPKKRLAYLG